MSLPCFQNSIFPISLDRDWYQALKHCAGLQTTNGLTKYHLQGYLFNSTFEGPHFLQSLFSSQKILFFLIWPVRERSRSIYSWFKTISSFNTKWTGVLLSNKYRVWMLCRPRYSYSTETCFCRRYKHCYKIFNLTVILMRIQFFWHMTVCQLVNCYGRFGVACCLISYGLRVMDILEFCIIKWMQKAPP